MKRAEVEILFSQEAEREFAEIQSCERSLIRDLARRYLEDLVLFPPGDWVDLRSRSGTDVFKSDNHIPFDIQGKVYGGKSRSAERVLITRFRRRKGS
jgi:hypothetical protein